MRIINISNFFNKQYIKSKHDTHNKTITVTAVLDKVFGTTL